MTYLEHVGKYFIMLGRVFKKPQKPLIFYQALLKEIDDLVEAVLEREGKELFEMRYTNDAHLSEYGHSVIATILTDILLDPILIDK